MEQIEVLCDAIPFGATDVRFGNMKDYKRCEIATTLVQVLVRYDSYLTENPECRLRPDLPVEPLADLALKRYLGFLASIQGKDLALGLRSKVYDLGKSLIIAGHDEEAVECMKASYPSGNPDHAFWIFASQYNVAMASEKTGEIREAIEWFQRVDGGDATLPDAVVERARAMLERLEEVAARSR